VILEECAMSGLVLCRPLKPLEMNQQDVAIRFGQLLCRWASDQDPAFHLHVGVDTGSLTSFILPGGSSAMYTGDAVQGAKYLAHCSDQEQMVHLSKRVRDRLGKLASLQMLVSAKRDSFYLDTATAVRAVQDRISNTPISGGGHQRRTKKASTMREQLQVELERGDEEIHDFDRNVTSMILENQMGSMESPSESDMTFEQFKNIFLDHKVDIDDFGGGDARSLEEMYKEIVVDKDAHLVVTSEGALRRVKELVRITLLVRGTDSRLRELRIASQQRGDGLRRQRNQKLAMVLKMRAGDSIKDSIEACFTEKFNLNLAYQKQCFDVDWDSHTFKEECMVSTTVPNLMTIYKTHCLVVNIRDKTHKELSVLGLPAGTDFKTTKDNRDYYWTWAVVGNSKEDELLALLNSHGIESSEFTLDAFADLYDEVHETGLSSLEVQDGILVRKIRIVKVWLHADILSLEHVLQVKRKLQKGKSNDQDKGRPLSMRIPKFLEWEKAVETIFLQRLGLDSSCQKAISVDPLSYRLSEEVAYSRSFPGLKTVYLIDEVTAHVVDVNCPSLAIIGLPDGHDFAFSRFDTPKGPGESKFVIQHWCWNTLESFRKERRLPTERMVLDKAPTALVTTVKRRLPVPDAESATTAFGMCASSSSTCLATGGGTILERLMRGRRTDWARARNAASRIRDRGYTCKEFHDDVSAAFPELLLYMGDIDVASSGRSSDDEYQRTFGAMFAFFWLMRLHLDGGQCFSYGLGTDWNLRRRPGGRNREDEEEWEARQAFHEKVEWNFIQMLLVSAGLLKEGSAEPATGDFFSGSGEAQEYDEERTLAMLVLTAIHDIMKLQMLLPTVTKTPFRGYQVGETIHDHDLALAYVLERQPKLLPSFAGLPKSQQASILFSQSKMEYNMGWMVQAEAPPGALLRKFREVVTSGAADSKDISFYFVHWFTDLAGAEPYPLEGCEKFVLKFPRKVLNQFLQSFSILQSLSPETNETEVLEAYLDWRWEHHDPPLGEVPSGRDAIARMRLVIMAQGDSQAILDGYDALSEEDRAVLATEMACTGCRGQFFQRWPGKEESTGPAFLIYYAPALMQKAGRENPTSTMRVLAEVYRQARALWPASPAKADETITLRIDALKVLTLPNILSRDNETVWMLSKLSSKEASVQLLPVSKVTEIDWSSNRTLEFR